MISYAQMLRQDYAIGYRRNVDINVHDFKH